MKALVAQYQAYAQANTYAQSPQNLYAPVNYILSIGGKQLRPALLLASYQLWHQDVTPVLSAAHAIEVFHNFTLMHDDIMDAADMRRGQATAHVKYNTNTAILSGDAMLILAYQALLQATPSPAIREIMTLFNQTALEVCEGQQYDVDFETRSNVTIPEYIKMIELKTAVLLACALKIGGILAGTTERDAANLYEFGRCIGIAFQLQDDILDTFGDSATFGKRIGGDILNNKKTYLVLRTQQLADERVQTELAHLLSTTQVADEQAKIDAVTAIFNQVGVEQHAKQLMNDFFRRGMIALDAVEVSDEKKATLRNFATQLMTRAV